MSAGKMIQCVKVHSPNPHNLSSMPGNYMLKERTNSRMFISHLHMSDKACKHKHTDMCMK